MEWVEGRIKKRSVDAAEAPETRNALTERAHTGADKVDLSSAREKIIELMYEIEALKRQHSGSYLENLKAELSISYATNRGFRQQCEDKSEENGNLNAELKRERKETEKLNAELKHERKETEKLNAKLKHESEENGNLNAELKHESEENQKLNAELKHERKETEKLNAKLKHELEENENLNAELKHEREESEKLNAELRHERKENEKLNAALKFSLLENDNLSELTRSLRAHGDGLDGLPTILEIIADQLERGPCPLRLPEIIDGDATDGLP